MEEDVSKLAVGIQHLQDWLVGKKTYIIAAFVAVDAAGQYLGYWTENSFRLRLEEVFALITLRASVPKV